MYSLVIVVHVLVSLVLIIIILVQGGRGGMAETLGGSAAQSLFGGGANVVMTRVTAIGAGLFMVTCLTLAVLSSQRGRSVIDQMPMTLPAGLPSPVSASPAPTGREEASPPRPSAEPVAPPATPAATAPSPNESAPTPPK